MRFGTLQELHIGPRSQNDREPIRFIGGAQTRRTFLRK